MQNTISIVVNFSVLKKYNMKLIINIYYILLMSTFFVFEDNYIPLTSFKIKIVLVTA